MKYNPAKLLRVAKENVKWLLNHADGLIDMKGLVYWAKRVEELREVVRSEL